MKKYEHLSPVTWDCKYHIIWVPKYQRKQLYGARRRHFGKIVHDISRQKDIQVVEGHAMVDHVHVCLSFAPKFRGYFVSTVGLDEKLIIFDWRFRLARFNYL